jgi:lactoylglutathione lyase
VWDVPHPAGTRCEGTRGVVTTRELTWLTIGGGRDVDDHGGLHPRECVLAVEDRRMTVTLRCEIFPRDLDSTVDFYTTVLRFTLDRDERQGDSPYVALRRGEVLLGAASRDTDVARDQRRPPTGVELVLEVEDVLGELDYVRRQGWPVEEDLVARPWGLRDFRVLDPNGYYLRITERAPSTGGSMS